MAKQSVTFTIAGEDVGVSELTWDIIEDVVMPIIENTTAKSSAGESVPWYKHRADDLRILCAAVNRPYDEVRKVITMKEAEQVSVKMLDLLRISGFVAPGESQAASDSTETSTGSSPDSLPEGSPA